MCDKMSGEPNFTDSFFAGSMVIAIIFNGGTKAGKNILCSMFLGV